MSRFGKRAPGLRLAALDTHSTDIVGFGRVLEKAGYHRYWATEHHSPNQSASPVIAATAVASATSHIRVGTAGILLAYSTSRKVVEDFALLECLFGSRVDLGVASGSISGKIGDDLLDGRPQPTFEAYATKAAEVVKMVRDEPVQILGSGIRPPELWLCGKSRRSAELAGSLGLSYAFHHHLNQGAQAVDGVAVVNAYRAAYGSTDLECPCVSIACFGYCAEDRADAHQFWRSRTLTSNSDSSHSLQAPSFLGDPDECRQQLRALADRYDADEVALEMVAPSPTARWASFCLIAEAIRRE